MKTLLIILTLAVAAFGQTVTELQAKAKTLKANKEIFVTYDKFKDRSTIITKPFNLIGGNEAFLITMADGLARGPYGSGRGSGVSSVLLLNIGYAFKGEKLENPPTKYALLFTSSSSDWVFLKGDKNVYFLFDEQRLELKPIDTDSDVGYKSVSEQLAYEITREDLLRIAKAKTVELKIGPMPRKLKQDLLDRFAKMIELTQ